MNSCYFLLAAVAVVSAAPVNNADFEKYLKQYGYLKTIAEPRDSMQDPGVMDRRRKFELQSAIVKFQNFAGLPITGVLDEETKHTMMRPRCGVPDFENAMKDESVPYVYRWDKTVITWALGSYNSTIGMDNTRRAMYEAFQAWQEVIPLEFREMSSSSRNVDIRIDFGRLAHGDPWAFDGAGGVLAHAMFPKAGSTHFDDDEPWAYKDGPKVKNYQYIDLLAVAIHEIGHALGLHHTTNRDAIMAPVYTAPTRTDQYIMPKLHADDVQRIQKIYGKRPSVTRTTTTTPKPTTRTTTITTTTRRPITHRPAPVPRLPVAPRVGEEPDETACPTRIQAATQALNGRTYLFADDRAWEFDGDYVLGSRKITDLFPGGPARVTAAVTSPRHSLTVLISDKRVFLFRWNGQQNAFELYRIQGYPKPLPADFPFTPQAAFLLSDRNVILFGGESFATYSIASNKATFVANSDSYFAGIPKNAVAVLQKDSSRLLMLTDREFYLYDTQARRIEPKYPQPLRDLLRCI